MALHRDNEGTGEGHRSAGEVVDMAQKISARADGEVIMMLVRRKLSHSRLRWAAEQYEKAAHLIRSCLPEDGGGV